MCCCHALRPALLLPVTRRQSKRAAHVCCYTALPGPQQDCCCKRSAWKLRPGAFYRVCGAAYRGHQVRRGQPSLTLKMSFCEGPCVLHLWLHGCTNGGCLRQRWEGGRADGSKFCLAG